MKTLYALDGSNGTLDPSFDAHVVPIMHWSLAWWEKWADPSQLGKAYERRMEMPQEHRKQWARVAGPTAALDRYLQRVGWKW